MYMNIMVKTIVYLKIFTLDATKVHIVKVHIERNVQNAMMTSH